MPIDLDYFRAVQGATGLDNIQNVVAEETKARLKRDFLTSVNCEYHSQRNGVEQKFIVTSTDRVSLMDIIAFPDEPLEIGDLIDCYGEKWIVTAKYAINTFQWKGKMQQCNHLLRFQNGTPDILERWIWFDSGVYSTTEHQVPVGAVPDQQFKIYVQFDEDTRKIFVGKRLAIERWTDAKQKPILLCYRVTAPDSVSKSYGNGKLLMLKCRSDQYDPKSDNLDEMICDFVAPGLVVPPSADEKWW